MAFRLALVEKSVFFLIAKQIISHSKVILLESGNEFFISDLFRLMFQTIAYLNPIFCLMPEWNGQIGLRLITMDSECQEPWNLV